MSKSAHPPVTVRAGGETKGEDVDTLLSLASISGEEKLTKEQQRVATSRAVRGCRRRSRGRGT